MIQARVLADSISNRDFRLITVEVTFPRYLLSEFNTHRLFSRNSASSRAIPPEKQLLSILDDPFIPQEFYGRAKGMGQDEPLTGFKREQAEEEWLRARDEAMRQTLVLLTNPEVMAEAERTAGPDDPGGFRHVIGLVADVVQSGDVPEDWLNISKSTVNRLLETFKWQTVIVTSTEWENFFALRCPPGYEVDPQFPAEPEIQRTALAMREVMRASTPNDLSPGEWHTPMVEGGFVGMAAAEADGYFWPKVSAGRCARVSFDTHENFEEEAKSLARAEGLETSGHMSPFEHVATPFTDGEWFVRDEMKRAAETGYLRGEIDKTTSEQMVALTRFNGNFAGWTQYRKLVPHEENRRGHIEEREPWDHAGLPEHQPVMGGEV